MKVSRSAVKARATNDKIRSPLGLVNTRSQILKKGHKNAKRPFDLAFRVRSLALVDILRSISQSGQLKAGATEEKNVLAKHQYASSESRPLSADESIQTMPGTVTTACLGRTQPADVQQRLDSQHNPTIPEGEAVCEQDREGSPRSARTPVDSEDNFSKRISAQEINDLLETARNARQVLTHTRCGRPVDLAGVATRLKISTFHQQYSWRTHLQEIMARVAEARRLEEARREEHDLQASLLHEKPSTVEPRPYPDQLESLMAPQHAITPQPEQSVLSSQAQAQQLPSSLLDTVRAKQYAALQHSAEASPVEGILERGGSAHQQETPAHSALATPVEGVLERAWGSASGYPSAQPQSRGLFHDATPNLPESPSEYREQDDWVSGSGTPYIRGLNCAPDVPTPLPTSTHPSPPSQGKSDLDGADYGGFDDGMMSDDECGSDGAEEHSMHDDASPAYKEGSPGEEGQEEQHPSTRIPSHPTSPVAADEARLPLKSVDPEMDAGSNLVHASPSIPGATNVCEPSTATNESELQQEDSPSQPPLVESDGDPPADAGKEQSGKERRKTEINLRLKQMFRQRKSLAGEGMQSDEGKRRSTRQRHRPLEWWRQETKIYSREHRSEAFHKTIHSTTKNRSLVPRFAADCTNSETMIKNSHNVRNTYSSQAFSRVSQATGDSQQRARYGVWRCFGAEEEARLHARAAEMMGRKLEPEMVL